MSLDRYIERTACAPFVWGCTDCASWAAGAVHAVTGVDPLAGLRGTYGSAFEARQLVQRHGGLRNFVRARMEPFAAHEAGDGVALARVDGRAICGVLHRDRLLLKSERGLVFADAATIEEAWSLCLKP